jgi:membrane protein YdbS with pleckstrin-like domain
MEPSSGPVPYPSSTGLVEVPRGPTALAPATLVLWRLQGAGFAAVVTLLTLSALAVVAQAGDEPMPLAVAGCAVVVAVGWVVALAGPGMAWGRWRYELGEETLELRHGVIVHTESSIPYFRVQHVDVHQGPLERWLGIARLEIATASSATDAQIPGVELALAEPIRAYVLGRTGDREGL